MLFQAFSEMSHDLTVFRELSRGPTSDS